MKDESKRTKAAILFSNIVGYTAVMGGDQELGDGVLCYFPTADDAVSAGLQL